MADVASVRAEIKAWERGFYDEHGRNPTVNDIRENQLIANKYRLYKKLSKVALSEKPDPIITSASMPRETAQSSSMISKPRALESTSALSSYNPFSPRKNNGKQKALANTADALLIVPNPFATPSKNRPKSRIREPSPSPVHQIASALVISQNMPPEPPTAVKRARKRLRGEPVSPSPRKDKRRRVSTDGYPSGSDDGQDTAGNSSFVADSPVKGSSSFKSLFEDKSGSTKMRGALNRSKSTSIPAGLFGPIREQSASVEDDFDSVLGPVGRKAKSGPSVSLITKLLPGEDNLHTTRDSTSQPSSSKEESTDRQKSGKRTLPDSDSETEIPAANSASSEILLVPPSPPSEPVSFNRGKSKVSHRKKIRVEEAEGDGDDSLSDDIKVVTRPVRAAGKGPEEYDSDVGPEFDPLFWYTRRGEESQAVKGDAATGTFEVDLPDKLKHVLSLTSSDTKLRDVQEEHVAESLIYGRRTTHYEPSRGGEIWDVGDVDDGDTQDEGGSHNASVKITDEDWEGEPVPWEAGEL